jgi:dihydroorotate dehydrogenase (fumarate)
LASSSIHAGFYRIFHHPIARLELDQLLFSGADLRQADSPAQATTSGWLPLLWIAVPSGRIDASLAACTGVEYFEQVIKYLLAGADVVMTTSALLRNGPRYVGKLLTDTVSWLTARDIESVGQIRGLPSQRRFRNPELFGRANYMKILHGYRAVEMLQQGEA